jgi:hypothetical protein
LASWYTPEGSSATRCSCVLISFGTPMVMAEFWSN